MAARGESSRGGFVAMGALGAGRITRCVDSVKQGEVDATVDLWDAYFIRLVGLARRRLGSNRHRVDPEEAASSTLRLFFQGLSSGRFPDLHDRDEAWRLLATMVVRKADQLSRAFRRQKRGAGWHRMDASGLADRPSGPSIAAYATALAELVETLPTEQERLLVLWRLEGRGLEFMAHELRCSKATVNRKLDLIRKTWSYHLE